MPKFIGESKVPVMEFCEYCWEVLNEDGTCPTEGCVHNDLLNEVLNEVHEDEATGSAQL